MIESDPSGPIALEIRQSVAIIKFNRPATRNSLSVETLTTLEAVVAHLNARRDLHTLIFTGSDDVFLSGADIGELSKLDQQDALRFADRGQRLFTNIAKTNQRTIAAINGHCMGGGLDLALACDIRIASPASQFAHPGARLGIITGWGGTQRLPRIIGRARAIEFLTTARRINAADALRIRLIHAIDPVPLQLVLRTTQELTKTWG